MKRVCATLLLIVASAVFAGCADSSSQPLMNAEIDFGDLRIGKADSYDHVVIQPDGSRLKLSEFTLSAEQGDGGILLENHYRLFGKSGIRTIEETQFCSLTPCLAPVSIKWLQSGPKGLVSRSASCSQSKMHITEVKNGVATSNTVAWVADAVSLDTLFRIIPLLPVRTNEIYSFSFAAFDCAKIVGRSMIACEGTSTIDIGGDSLQCTKYRKTDDDGPDPLTFFVDNRKRVVLVTNESGTQRMELKDIFKEEKTNQ